MRDLLAGNQPGRKKENYDMSEQVLNSDHLLPCPFCGARPVRRINNDILFIECRECVSIGFHNHVRLGCQADQEWNRRTEAATND